ncbi:hypothetical protein MNBD_ALPHA04-1960 [hydrothermal vent metagenome]|uniref:peptidylprolyl isomerase n=1 Tax=hydrothermal vent metagenome TaxID=652676 RepID=A0A3B0S0F7_9ZZZZ
MDQPSRLKQLFKEPLIHFLGGALLIFGFFWATGTNRDPADYAIAVSQGDIARMKAGWAQNFRRPPTQKELDGLIEQQITEEIYYREALRLGLDRNDAVIRRRMFTKMRFLNNQGVANDGPSETELRDWMEENSEKYTLSPSYSFEQIFLGQVGEIDETEIEQMVSQLNKGIKQPSALARPISLPEKLTEATRPDIARQFGERFTAALDGLESGKWTGPVRSGFGRHLVKISAKIVSRPAVLDDVRQTVENDWRAAQTVRQEEKMLESYRSQYEIKVAGRE